VIRTNQAAVLRPPSAEINETANGFQYRVHIVPLAIVHLYFRSLRSGPAE